MRQTKKKNNTSANHQGHHKKPRCQGHKSMRGVPEIYDQKKEKSVNICMTETGRDGLDQLAAYLHLSRSQLVEIIGRSFLKYLEAKASGSTQEPILNLPLDLLPITLCLEIE